MQKTRADITTLLMSIKHTKERYMYLEKEIISVSTQAEYDRTVDHYDQLILALTKELHALPIGYRYTGPYYLKKPYTMPPEFEEGSGSLYMKENLVSWQTETGPGVYDSPYYRAVF